MFVPEGQVANSPPFQRWGAEILLYARPGGTFALVTADVPPGRGGEGLHDPSNKLVGYEQTSLRDRFLSRELNSPARKTLQGGGHPWNVERSSPQGRSDLEFVGKYHERFAGLRMVIEFKYYSNTEFARFKTPIEEFQLQDEDSAQLAGYVEG